MGKVRSADGIWREAKSTQKTVPDHLRHLPSDYVTKDASDPERIHPSDDPHIVDNLTKERHEKEIGTYVDPAAEPDPAGAGHRGDKALSQRKVDEVRLRVIRAYAQTNVRWLAEGLEPDRKPKPRS